MIHIMMDINEHQDQRYTRGDNNGCDLYLLGVNVFFVLSFTGNTGLKNLRLTRQLTLFSA